MTGGAGSADLPELSAAEPQLSVEGLRTDFSTDRGIVRAVADVSFRIYRGETLALVGESGSGKSVTSLSIMRLLAEPAGRISSGAIKLRRKDGSVRDLVAASEEELCRIRGNDVAMIFQEPMTSLNPVQRVGDQIAEVIYLHEQVSRREALDRTRQLLRMVEISDPDRRIGNYPHQMSGGMRQRVMIAMALACRPALLIADEPTTALDVTIQAQVLEIMRRLQRELGMAILFITHNLGVVAEIASRVAVMYGGYVVEEGLVTDIFRAPRHPYTIGLIKSLPQTALLERETLPRTDERRRLHAIPGSVPSPANLPPGCPFATRCAMRVDACEERVPPLAEVGKRHVSRCIRWTELAA
jgi:oligopeptide/dipeptide ABC transporter ATP-binding protein